jgi:hypothetical protein
MASPRQFTATYRILGPTRSTSPCLMLSNAAHQAPTDERPVITPTADGQLRRRGPEMRCTRRPRAATPKMYARITLQQGRASQQRHVTCVSVDDGLDGLPHRRTDRKDGKHVDRRSNHIQHERLHKQATERRLCNVHCALGEQRRAVRSAGRHLRRWQRGTQPATTRSQTTTTSVPMAKRKQTRTADTLRLVRENPGGCMCQLPYATRPNLPDLFIGASLNTTEMVRTGPCPWRCALPEPAPHRCGGAFILWLAKCAA